MRATARILSPIIILAMLLSAVAVLAPPMVQTAAADSALVGPGEALYGCDASGNLVTYDPVTGAATVVGPINHCSDPGGMVADPDGFLYVYDNGGDELLLVDPADPGSATILNDYPGFEYDITALAGNESGGYAFGTDSYLYHADPDTFALSQVGEIYNNITSTGPFTCGGAAFCSSDSLWGLTTGYTPIQLLQIDPATGNVLSNIPLSQDVGDGTALVYDPSMFGGYGGLIGASKPRGEVGGYLLFDLDWGGYVENVRELDPTTAPQGLGLVAAPIPCPDPTSVPFFDDMESGPGDWRGSGFWHQTNLTVPVYNAGGAVPDCPVNDINPDCVTLPDTDASGLAYTPDAYSGDTCWWYGVDDNGTFIDPIFDPGLQGCKDGGTSSMANQGTLWSPPLDLTSLTNATLSFKTWWEIEGVDADSFDMMYVMGSNDCGATSFTIGALNPLNDVNNEPYQNYSSGGSNSVPVWVSQVFDLSAYAGSVVSIGFLFDTVDPLYNGFRGWFIDDFLVTGEMIPPPVITDVDPSYVGDPTQIVSIFGENFAGGASVHVGDALADKSVVMSSGLIQFLIPALDPGVYDVTVTNPDGQSDTLPDALTIGDPLDIVADFVGDPLVGPAPLTVDFTDLSTGTVTHWNWDFGDSSTGTQQNPVHEYAAPGMYTVSLTASNDLGGEDTEIKEQYIMVETVGPAPSIWWDPLSAHFDMVPDTTRGFTLTVGNDGDADLWFELATLAPWLTFGAYTNTVAPDASQDIPFTVDTAGMPPGSYGDDILISHNDPMVGDPVVVPVTVDVHLPVDPPYIIIEEPFCPGQSIEDILKTVFVPDLPPMIDIYLLEDESGSFGDDIDNLQAMAPDIFDAIRAEVPDSMFGVGGFCDFPFSPWGSDADGDVAYRLIQNLTVDRATFLAGVDLLTITYGMDGPESQLEGLYQAATGAGVDLNGDGDYEDLGDVAPGQNPTWRPDAFKVVILATDADFHYPGDGTGDYPGPSMADTIDALIAAGITVIGIESWGPIAQLHEVADATGGMVEEVSSSGEEIADAILDGLGAMAFTVTPEVVGAGPIEVIFDPPVHEGVPGGSLVEFGETILVPEGTPPGEHCFEVQFLANDGLIGTQYICLEVLPENWVVMVYMAADNDLGWGVGWEQLMSIGEAFPSPFVDVLVLWDGPEFGDSQIYRKANDYYPTDGGPYGMIPVDDGGAVIGPKHEVNMGNPETLENFIDWVRDNYPVETGPCEVVRDALILWDHGAGWRPCSFSIDRTDMDSLSIMELGDALDMATYGGEMPLDVVGFDACLMQMLEVDFQIMDYTEYIVGSEEVEPVPGWPYWDVMSQFAMNPNMTGEMAATMMVYEYEDWYLDPESPFFFPWATLSAKDASLIGPLVAAVDVFALELLNSIGVLDEGIATARAMAETFGEVDWSPPPMDPFTGSPGSIDLYDFACLIAEAMPIESPLGAAAAAVMEAVDDAVVLSIAGPEHPNASGIAIYYPDIVEMGDGMQMMVYEPCYDYATAFPMVTLWDEYLKLAPRLVHEGIVAMYIPDVLLLAHVWEDPIIRFDWMGEYMTEHALPEGFTLVGDPVNIVVTPEGTIDIGVLAMLYSKADLNYADVLKTQLIGVGGFDEGAWQLEKLTMDLPSWIFDLGGILGPMTAGMDESAQEAFLGVVDGLDVLGGIVKDRCGPCVDYIGAAIAVPWLDLSHVAPWVYWDFPGFPMVSSDLVNSFGIIATEWASALTPIQYPQNLYEGWNLFSLPVIPLDADIDAILTGNYGLVDGVEGAVDVIWQYDAVTGEWHAYSPAAPEASDLTELKDGVGYWAKMLADATLTVVGCNMLAAPFAPPEYDLVEGWNLIGYKGILPMAPQGTYYYYEYYDYYWDEWYYEEWYIGGYLEWDKVDYNRLQGYHRVWDTLITPDFLLPNEGYWIYVPEGGAGSIPGLNDENWVTAVEYGDYEWFEATADWISYWMMEDGELGLRLAWNAAWYAAWVIAPSMMDGGSLPYFF